jgi:hypothetical protein
MKTYRGSGGIAPRILDLGTRWRWVVSFTPQPLYPGERFPGTHWIGGWVGPRAERWTTLHNEELNHVLLGWSNQGGRARICGTRGRDEKCIQNLDRKTWRDETTSDLDSDGRIILEWILEKPVGKVWTGCNWLKIVGCCKHSDEPLLGTENGEFLD